MSRVIAVCEGATEQEFCKRVLASYLFQKYGIAISPPVIDKSGGGLVSWSALKYQIEGHLKAEEDCFVTTLIDWYGIKASHNFPMWDKCDRITDVYKKVRAVEEAMKGEIDESLRYRFIPNFLVHEFEALLFCDKEVFYKYKVDSEGLNKIFKEFSNPELINGGLETSPSHRLKRIVDGYSKVIVGPLLAESIGIPTMRVKAPHFNGWVETLISVASTQASITQ
jgi:hypothetical protein